MRLNQVKLLCSKFLETSSIDHFNCTRDINELCLWKPLPFLAGSEAFCTMIVSKRTAILDSSLKRYGSCELLLSSILLLCGDIQTNPGPPKHPCGLCSKPVKRNQKGIECEDCFEWFHTDCIFMSTKSYQNFADNTKLVWMCNGCMFPNFSTSFLLSNTSDFTVTNSFESLSQSSPRS